MPLLTDFHLFINFIKLRIHTYPISLTFSNNILTHFPNLLGCLIHIYLNIKIVQDPKGNHLGIRNRTAQIITPFNCENNRIFSHYPFDLAELFRAK